MTKMLVKMIDHKGYIATHGTMQVLYMYEGILFFLQILSGTYPIAQVREPYSVVGYLAACTPLEKVLNLVHPKIAQAKDDNVPEDIQWSAWDICDGNG